MVYTAKVWHAAAFSCNGLREASALMRTSSLNFIAERLSARLMIAHWALAIGVYTVYNYIYNYNYCRAP